MAARKKPAPKKAAAKPKTRPADSAKGGRPTKRTPEVEAAILSVVGAGLSLETAADRARIDRSTLTRWMQTDAGFAQSVWDARAESNESVATALLRNALDGNVQAQQFWLTRRTKEFREAKDQPLDLPGLDGIESVSDLGRLAALVLASALRDGAPGSAVQAISGAISGAAKAQEVTELRQKVADLERMMEAIRNGNRP